MRNRIRIPTRPTRFWAVAAPICFISMLLIGDASQSTAAAQFTFGQRGGFRSGLGLGVGIGGMIVSQPPRGQVEESRDAPVRGVTKKQGEKRYGSSPSKNTKNKKKQEPMVATKKNEPDTSSKTSNEINLTKKPAEAPPLSRTAPTLVANPVAESPASTAHKNCGGCNELWTAIVRHQNMIAEEEKKLAATAQKFEQDVRHRDWLKAQWSLANSDVEKDYYQQATRTTEKVIDGLIEQIDRIRDLIREEKARLAQRVTAYQRCIDTDCAQTVAESPAAAPPTISVRTAP